MKNNRQLPAYHMKPEGTVFHTLADISENELTDDQKKIVAQFENLAETYLSQVEKLNDILIRDYKKLLQKHKDADDPIILILNETLHQLFLHKYFPGYRKHKIK